jgi:hypothetical protein
MHLNTPDLNLLSFQDGCLMIADINNNVYSNAQLDTTKNKIESTYTKDQDDKVLVKISDLINILKANNIDMNTASLSSTFNIF